MSKKVFIDPGHGGTDSGAVGVNNLLEKDINLQVAKKVRDLLVKQGLEVILSREKDEFISLEQRAKNANNLKVDCFVSIHCNAYNGTAKGIETFSYSTKTNDLASNVHSNLLETKAYTVNRGLKTASYYVLKYTNMRACLVELGFIDNVEDAKLLVNNQDNFALGIAKGICEYLNVNYTINEPVKEVEVPVNDSNLYYRVVCGSFKDRINAEQRIEELNEKGFKETFILIYKKEE